MSEPDEEGFPRDWDIEDKVHKIYDNLTEKTPSISPFRGKDMADVFIYAMALGFYNGRKQPLRGKKSSSIPLNVLRNRLWLIRAVAVADQGDLAILSNKQEVARIAEEYANGGIKILDEMVFGGQPGDAHKKMHADLLSVLK